MEKNKEQQEKEKVYYDKLLEGADEITKQKITENVELLVNLMNVETNMEGNITSDYTLAKLGEAEREFITENYGNAEYAKNLFNRIKTKGYRYVWDEETKDWKKEEDGSYKKEELTDPEKKLLDIMGKRIFTYFMIQPHLMAILNRNRDENFLVKLLGKPKEEEEQVMFGAEDRGALRKLYDKVTGKEEGEKE